MRFSERKGLKPVSDIMQVDGMSDELRTSIWNVLDIELWSVEGFVWVHGRPSKHIIGLGKTLYYSYIKKPLDQLPSRPDGILKVLRERFFLVDGPKFMTLLRK